MCRARDAGIVIANELLTCIHNLRIRTIKNVMNHQAQIVFDPAAVLARRRHDLGALHDPLIVDAVAVIELAITSSTARATIPA
jgi:hypothetical protein